MINTGTEWRPGSAGAGTEWASGSAGAAEWTLGGAGT